MEQQIRQKQLEEAIITYNELYRRGKSRISDLEYDLLIKELKTSFPDSSLLQKNILEVPKPSRKQKLPINMFSLDKLQDWDSVKKWINKYQREFFIITPKFDGISLLTQESEGACWTRGDGEEGQISEKHYSLFDKNCNSSPIFFGKLFTWGEAIILRENWEKVKKIIPDYKNPRNAVAGIFNKQELTEKYQKVLPYVTYIRYGYNKENSTASKDMQLDILNECQVIITPYFLELDKNITEELLTELFIKWSKIFDIDGLVIELNDNSLRKQLGKENNNNPKYAKAIKLGWEEIKKTKIIDIKFQVSKDGRLKPIGIIEPIILAGAEVNNVTLYNAAYIYKKGISIGVEIELIRSGEVIPKITKVLNPIKNPLSIASDLNKLILRDLKLPNNSLGGNYVKWDKTGVDFLLKDRNDLWDIAENTFFFNTMGIEGFDEPSIKKLYDAGYNTIYSILNMSKEEIIKIEGFGEITANYLKTIFNSWAEEGVNLYKLAAASNKFERMGEKLLAEIPYEYYFENIFSKKEFLKKIPGFGDIRVESFINNLPQFISFINKLPIKIIKPEKKEESLFFISNKCEGVKVVCTQFRDLELEQLIFLNGGQLLDHINKKATHLLVKEKNKGTKKELKAIQLSIPIWTKEEFLNFYNL